jgi:ATP-dependent DNA helicase RecQ
VKSIENRRKNKLRQLADILYYSFTKHICRSVILTKYFGELNPSECLVCDVCLQKKKLGLMGEEYEKISNDIIRELGLKKQSIQQLAALMTQYQESKLLETVQWLMECNKIERNDKGQLQITES